ncbi:MAG: FkbM family methyltransferase [Sulfurovum sp.]
MKKILYRLLYKVNLLKKINFKSNIKLNQKNITIPINGGVGFDNLDISEIWMVDILKSLDIERGIFIDIGVNIGQTLIKVKSIYDEVEYIGFEPNSLCVSYVNRLIEINKWRDITIVPVGIMQKCSILSLEYYSDSNTDSSASLVPNYRKNSKIYKRETIATFSVDRVNHLWEDKNISVIKIDVEGAEMDVIFSLKDIIKRDRPTLLVEILPIYEEKNIKRLDNQTKIESILNELDYIIYRVYKKENNSFDSFKEIKSIGIHSNLTWCDYIFSPTKIS